MANKDIYHDHVRNALLKEDWTITHEFLRLSVGKKDLYIDLGAQRLIGAERGTEKIAVEVKSFVGKSDVEDLEKALGQFVLYEDICAKSNRIERCILRFALQFTAICLKSQSGKSC